MGKPKKKKMIEAENETLAHEMKESEAKEREEDWQGENHARTLIEAQEIMDDEKKLERARKHIEKKKKAIRSTEDLVNYRNSMYGPKSNKSADGV